MKLFSILSKRPVPAAAPEPRPVRPSRVDDVVAEFSNAVANLKLIADRSTEIANHKQERIAALALEREEATREATRARAVAEKINGLLN